MNTPKKSGSSTLLATIVGGLISLGVIGSVLFVVFVKQSAASVSTNFFEEPGHVAGLLRHEFGDARIHEVHITRASIEVYAQRRGEYARYSLSAQGRFLRHGDDLKPPEYSLPLDEIDWSHVRPVFAHAAMHLESPPKYIVLSAHSGGYEWVATHAPSSAEGLVYSSDGRLKFERIH